MSNFQTPIKTPYSHTSQNAIQRDGDWICYNCTNLNFSFRKRCNRCKNQTREQNQQYAQYYRIAQICYNSHLNSDTPSFYTNQHQIIQTSHSSKQFEISIPNPQNQNYQFQPQTPKTKRSLSQKVEYKQKQITILDFNSSVQNWNLFLNHKDQSWESTCSDSSGQNSQEYQLLDYQIQQMVTKIII